MSNYQRVRLRELVDAEYRERNRLRHIKNMAAYRRRKGMGEMPQRNAWCNGGPMKETAADYAEHYHIYGWRYFTRKHCPPHLYDDVLALAPRLAA